MKFIHLGDLHIGKSLNQKSLLDVQEDMLNKVIDVCKEEDIHHVIIAGDIYDKALPPLEAVNLLNRFLTRAILKENLNIYMISGNHDSLPRINFLSGIVENDNLHIASKPSVIMDKKTVIEDGKKYNIYMLPYFSPTTYNQLGESSCKSYQEMFEDILKHNPLNKDEKNILVTHHLVTEGSTIYSDSELPLSVGGIDNIDASILKDFDYVALGHLHCPQHIKYPFVRYSGSLIKYSESEINQPKYFSIVDLNDELNIKKVPFTPLHDVIHLEGKLEDLTKDYENTCYDYVYVALTDEDIIPNAMARIRVKYPNAVALCYKNTVHERKSDIATSHNFKEKNILDQYQEFYTLINDKELTDKELKILKEVLEEDKA